MKREIIDIADLVETISLDVVRRKMRKDNKSPYTFIRHAVGALGAGNYVLAEEWLNTASKFLDFYPEKPDSVERENFEIIYGMAKEFINFHIWLKQPVKYSIN